MGDIAEMMLEGTLCAECGVVLKCGGDGIPILCHSCHAQYQKSCQQPDGGDKGGTMCENFYK